MKILEYKNMKIKYFSSAKHIFHILVFSQSNNNQTFLLFYINVTRYALRVMRYALCVMCYVLCVMRQ